MSKKDLVDGDIPRVTVSNFNNGITGYYANSDDKNYRTYQNFISVSFLGTVFYQPDKVSLDMKVHCLRPLDYELNVYSAGYIVSIIRKAISNFAYSDQLSSTILAELEFMLPATSDGQPDWDYMESYMKAVMEESEKSLENLRKADDTKHLIDVSGWDEFALSELVDEYYIAKSLDYGHLQEGDTAFINRSQVNNGIQGYVKADAYEKPNCITIGMIGNSKHAFWQTIWFVASQNILVLRNAVWNNYSASFICSIINSLLSDFQDYKDIIKKDDWMQNTKIKLPVTSTGEPDWQYMEDYMKNIMDKSEQIISDLQIGA